MLSAPEIQSLINTAHSQGGGIVILPVGEYNIQSQIVVKPGVILQGSGVAHYDWDRPGPVKGTIFDINWGSGEASSGDITKAAIVTNEGSTVRNIAFNYPKQDPLMNVPYEWGSTIQPSHSVSPRTIFNITVEDCLFFKSYIALDFRGFKSGNSVIAGITIRNNHGAPIFCCLAIDRVVDWCTIKDCRFNSGFINPTKNTIGLCKWSKENGKVIWAGGNDWLQIDNFQTWGYHTGAHIEAGRDYVASGPYSILNSSFDYSRVGFQLDGKFNQSVRIHNCNVTPLNDDGSGVVVIGSADFSNGALQFTNNYAFTNAYSLITLTTQLVNAIISHNVTNSTSTNYAAVIAPSYGKNVVISDNIFNGFQVDSTKVVEAPKKSWYKFW